MSLNDSAMARHCICITALALLGAAVSEANAQQAAWRVEDAAGAPDWLTLRGETRVRYETLDGQFRAGGAGGDQALAFRTLLLAEADAGPVAFGLEFQDARVLLDDSGTPLTTSIVNPFDLLQAYARIDADGWFGQPDATLIVGRQTLNIGSRRVLERVDMANVIFSYSGVYWRSENAHGDELHLLHVSPVGRLPNDRTALGEDELSGDEEEWGRRFWGAHFRRRDAFGAALPRVWAEAFIYGLDERDEAAVPTPDRHYLQPGARLYRAPETSSWDFDIEGSYRSGSRRETAAASDVSDLDVSAWTLHAGLGYTFDHPWRVRVGLDYDYASGDEDPNDGSYDQYERLFGSRRTDLGNTGIHGPLTPANIEAPGARIEIAPSTRLDARLAYKAAYLASETDAWVVARVRDPAGASGRFIGHSLDGRLRYWLLPQSLLFEVGASALIAGGFAETAPNASRQGDTSFGYMQLTQSF